MLRIPLSMPPTWKISRVSRAQKQTSLKTKVWVQIGPALPLWFASSCLGQPMFKGKELEKGMSTRSQVHRGPLDIPEFFPAFLFHNQLSSESHCLLKSACWVQLPSLLIPSRSSVCLSNYNRILTDLSASILSPTVSCPLEPKIVSMLLFRIFIVLCFLVLQNPEISFLLFYNLFPSVPLVPALPTLVFLLFLQRVRSITHFWVRVFL